MSAHEAFMRWVPALKRFGLGFLGGGSVAAGVAGAGVSWSEMTAPAIIIPIITGTLAGWIGKH